MWSISKNWIKVGVVAMSVTIALAPRISMADTLIMSRTECAALVEHVADDGVAYKPGVDVRGNPIVPADLGGESPISMPDTIDIAIGIDLADRMGLRARDQASTRPVLPYEGKAPLGTLSIRGNQVFWDGKILARQDVAAIAQACRDKL